MKAAPLTVDGCICKTGEGPLSAIDFGDKVFSTSDLDETTIKFKLVGDECEYSYSHSSFGK